MQGDVFPLASDQLEAAKLAYLASIPEAEPLFGFGDFELFSLSITSIYWVGGFGSAREVTLRQWQRIMGSEGGRN